MHVLKCFVIISKNYFVLSVHCGQGYINKKLYNAGKKLTVVHIYLFRTLYYFDLRLYSNFDYDIFRNKVCHVHNYTT